MASASASLSAVLLLGIFCSGVAASDRAETVASVRIAGSAGITVTNTVVNSAPLQTLLLTAAIAPTTVVFTASGAGPVSVSGGGAGPATVSGTSGGTPPAGGPGGNTTTGGAPQAGGAGATTEDGGGPAIVALGDAAPGAVVNGDAVSVNVGSVASGSTPGGARVPVVIAQYN